MDRVTKVLFLLSPQNSSLVQGNETAESDSMRLNPHVQYYSKVYVLSMGAVLFLKTLRGLVFVKVILRFLSFGLSSPLPTLEFFIKHFGPRADAFPLCSCFIQHGLNLPESTGLICQGGVTINPCSHTSEVSGNQCRVHWWHSVLLQSLRQYLDASKYNFRIQMILI